MRPSKDDFDEPTTPWFSPLKSLASLQPKPKRLPVFQSMHVESKLDEKRGLKAADSCKHYLRSQLAKNPFKDVLNVEAFFYPSGEKNDSFSSPSTANSNSCEEQLSESGKSQSQPLSPRGAVSDSEQNFSPLSSASH